MKFRNIRQLNWGQNFSGLPDFLRILHTQKPCLQTENQVKSQPIKQSQPDQWLQDIIQKHHIPHIQSNQTVNRHPMFVEDEQIRQSQQFQHMVDHRQQCQAIAQQLLGEPLNQWNHKYFNSLVDKYFLLLSQVHELKELQVLVDLFPLPLNQVQSQIHNINNHLAKAFILEKYQQYGQAYQNLLNHINQTYFSVKSIVLSTKPRKLQPIQSKFTFSSNLKELFLKILRISQTDYWKTRNPLNYINLFKQASNFVLFSFQNQLLSQFDDTIIDFMLITMTKICQNLSPMIIYLQFFAIKYKQVQSQILKLFCEQFIKHCKFYLQFYSCALKSFSIDQKRKLRDEKQVRKRGIVVKKNCNFCQQTLDQECSVIVYGCGHKFHSYCDNHQAYCEECSYISNNHLFEKIIFDKDWLNGPQVLGLPNREKIRKREGVHNKKEKQDEQKKEKLYQINRRFKMYDYEVYTQQKRMLDPMKEWNSAKDN